LRVSRRPFLRAASPAAVALLAAACGTSTGPIGTGTGTGAAAQGAAPAPPATPAAQPALVATTPAGLPTPAPTSATGAVATGAPVTITLSPDGSEARYRVKEQLVGRQLPNEAVGATRGVRGQIALSATGAVVREQSRITVDLATLRSDESRRDQFIRANTLQTQRFPTAEFVPAQVNGLPAPLPTSGEHRFQLVGDLTVHGVTRPATWEVTARAAGQEISGKATTQLKLTDFGMTPPRVGPVLSIEDAVILELHFRATRSG
jgi:polyisoprenoid-binding protein YceI